MKKILVVSDIHGDLFTLNKILNNNKNIDFRIFCGDLEIDDVTILENFNYSVLGNCDFYSTNNLIEKTMIVEIEGIKILITHGQNFGTSTKKIDFDILYRYAREKNVDLILYGHDHKKQNQKVNEIYFFNPGSTSFPKDGRVGSYGIITLEKGKIIELEHINIEKH